MTDSWADYNPEPQAAQDRWADYRPADPQAAAPAADPWADYQTPEPTSTPGNVEPEQPRSEQTFSAEWVPALKQGISDLEQSKPVQGALEAMNTLPGAMAIGAGLGVGGGPAGMAGGAVMGAAGYGLSNATDWLAQKLGLGGYARAAADIGVPLATMGLAGYGLGKVFQPAAEMQTAEQAAESVKSPGAIGQIPGTNYGPYMGRGPLRVETPEQQFGPAPTADEMAKGAGIPKLGELTPSGARQANLFSTAKGILGNSPVPEAQAAATGLHETNAGWQRLSNDLVTEYQALRENFTPDQFKSDILPYMTGAKTIDEVAPELRTAAKGIDRLMEKPADLAELYAMETYDPETGIRPFTREPFYFPKVMPDEPAEVNALQQAMIENPDKSSADLLAQMRYGRLSGSAFMQHARQNAAKTGLITDPDVVIPSYLNKQARLIAAARVWGGSLSPGREFPMGEDANDLLSRLYAKGANTEAEAFNEALRNIYQPNSDSLTPTVSSLRQFIGRLALGRMFLRHPQQMANTIALMGPTNYLKATIEASQFPDYTQQIIDASGAANPQLGEYIKQSLGDVDQPSLGVPMRMLNTTMQYMRENTARAAVGYVKQLAEQAATQGGSPDLAQRAADVGSSVGELADQFNRFGSDLQPRFLADRVQDFTNKAMFQPQAPGETPNVFQRKPWGQYVFAFKGYPYAQSRLANEMIRNRQYRRLATLTAVGAPLGAAGAEISNLLRGKAPDVPTAIRGALGGPYGLEGGIAANLGITYGSDLMRKLGAQGMPPSNRTQIEQALEDVSTESPYLDIAKQRAEDFASVPLAPDVPSGVLQGTSASLKVLPGFDPTGYSSFVAPGIAGLLDMADKAHRSEIRGQR